MNGNYLSQFNWQCWHVWNCQRINWKWKRWSSSNWNGISRHFSFIIVHLSGCCFEKEGLPWKCARCFENGGHPKYLHTFWAALLKLVFLFTLTRLCLNTRNFQYKKQVFPADKNPNLRKNLPDFSFFHIKLTDSLTRSRSLVFSFFMNLTVVWMKLWP